METAEIVNRALSKDEIAQVIEKTKAGEKSTRVSDDILYGKPAERPQPSIAEEDFIEVVRKHYRDVNVVNTFLGRCALTLKMPETQVTTGTNPGRHRTREGFKHTQCRQAMQFRIQPSFIPRSLEFQTQPFFSNSAKIRPILE